MIDLLTRLASINSYTHNLPGLHQVAGLLEREFSAFAPDQTASRELAPATAIDARGQTIQQPLGRLLVFSKRIRAPRRVLLVIHYDTVYPPEHPFQAVTRVDESTLRGPGVADAKGGIIVMLEALRRLEAGGSGLGWTVMLNPDEEIGSPGSAPHLVEAARAHQLGLVFEPAPSATTMVTQRKGSGNYAVVFRGRAAHAGRDFHLGRNAVLAAARFATQLSELSLSIPHATINIGRIDGGGPVNVVPDLAILRMNARVIEPEQQAELETRLEALVTHANREGITAELHGHFASPAWVMSAGNLKVFERFREIAGGMGLAIAAAMSGGASDANKMAVTGLPVLDSLGPVGANLHSAEETVDVGSIEQRAELVKRVMEDWAGC